MKKVFSTIFATFAGPVFLVLGLGVMYATFRVAEVDPIPVLTYLALLAPIWIPLTLFYILFDRWVESVRLKFSDENGRVTLRIILPPEVFKSPAAMETVISQIWFHGKALNLMQAYLDGKHPLVHSFELVSIGGDVRFYVNVPRKKTKNMIEAQLYAQYPGIEIVEEPLDYTAEVTWDPEKWEMMSFHFGKKEDEIYPIKTYIDFGLDKMPKEEEKIEPLAPLLEYLSSAKPSERIWIQILATPHSKQDITTGSLKPKTLWQNRVGSVVKDIYAAHKKQNDIPSDQNVPFNQLSESSKDMINAIERNTSKYTYDTAIRVIYAAPPKEFKGDTITSLIRAFSNYDIIGRNDVGVLWRTDFDYNFISDFSGKRKPFYKRRELDFYKSRVYLPFSVSDGRDAPKAFSAEELASLWYIPGKAILAPNVGRVESVRKDAPANLPIDTSGNRWS